jgi:ABC-2 type transport system ATP-binding protein
VIELKHLSKRYGDHMAVSDLDLSIDDGQIYGFLGPNGAGKSTTMNMMTGCLAPSEGTVLINGHDIFEDTVAAKKQIGYLPEIPPVYPEMTVREYLTFVAEAKKAGRNAGEEMEKAMQVTGTDAVSNRLIRHLSKGYRQRVGIAQALLGSPRVIILDEPTVGLDPAQIIEIRDLIKKLGEDHTVILSSHILSEVQACCDRIMIISRGKLVANDTPENLERMFAGATELKLTALGDADRAEEILRGIPGVTNIRPAASADAGCTDLTLTLADQDTDIRQSIFFAFASAHLPILEMKMSRASLEAVFLELTQAEAQEEKNAVSAKADAAPLSEEAAKETAAEEPGADDAVQSVPASAQNEAPADSTATVPEKEDRNHDGSL